MLDEIFHLFFPKLCVACNRSLFKNEEFLCSLCIHDLPLTHYHLHKGNDLEKVFWGRIPIESAMAMVHFKKKGSIQHVLHEIKYKNNTSLALFLGKYYANILKQSGLQFDGIMAIPLHKSKLKKRGYNQSELIGQGLASVLAIENWSSSIRRLKSTETQTKKSRTDRWENVKDVFEVTNPALIENKHILLVDDVITTGATIEACAIPILATKGVKLSIASLAFASH